MPAEFAIAVNSLLLQINDRRITAVPHWRLVAPGRMATTVIVPVHRAVKDVIQVPFADCAKRIEHLALERLDDPLDMRLQVR